MAPIKSHKRRNVNASAASNEVLPNQMVQTQDAQSNASNEGKSHLMGAAKITMLFVKSRPNDERRGDEALMKCASMTER
jgi:hypothetical protein